MQIAIRWRMREKIHFLYHTIKQFQGRGSKKQASKGDFYIRGLLIMYSVVFTGETGKKSHPNGN